MQHTWIFLALAPAAITANAADAPAAPVVVIQGSAAAYDARRDDTAAKIVVGRDELSRYGDTGVAEVLKRQPGVTVDGNGAIAMRGLGKGYTQILLNGDRAPTGFSIESLSPDLIERIEISRTPTADQRTEAIAGTINIILRKAGRRSGRGAKLRATRVGGHAGLFSSVEMSDAGQRLSYQLVATATDGEQHIRWRNRATGVDASGAPDLLRESGLDMLLRTRVWSVTPSATVKFDNGDTLSLQSYLGRSILDKDARGFSDTLVGAAEPVVRDTQVTGERNTAARAGAEWVHKFTPERSLNVKLNLAQFRRAAQFDQQGESALGAANLLDRTSSHVRERSIKNSGRYADRLSDRHALVAGWEAERTTHWQDRLQEISVEEAPGRTAFFDFDASVDRLALFVQDEWTASEQLALYLGLRAERIALRTTGKDFAPIARTDQLVSPVAQLLYKLPGSKGEQLRVGLSRTYKAPTPMALIPRPYTSTNNSVLNPDERGDPHLRPELALGVDGAYEHHWAKGAMVSIGGYLRRIDGVTRDTLALEGGRWVVYPVNGGKARLRGLEFDTRVKIADLLASAPRIDLRFNLTRNWSSLDDLPGPDNRVGEQLRLSSTLGADWQASSRWSLGASWSYKRGGQVRTATNRYLLTGKRSELDAYALATIAPQLKLRATVTNALADAEVTGSRYLGDGERRMLQTRAMPATLRLALEWAR